MRVSVATWYICPMGRRIVFHSRPCVVVIMTPRSLPIMMRSLFVGSTHMSWLSPPHPRSCSVVSPPSRLTPIPFDGK